MWMEIVNRGHIIHSRAIFYFVIFELKWNTNVKKKEKKKIIIKSGVKKRSK